MNRTELQQIAVDRVEDARILIANCRWSAAYYLVGYGVEAALKSCILRFVEDTGVIFKDKRFAEKCWTHRIEDLVRQANLTPSRGQDMSANPTRSGFWGVVEQWTEASRYDQASEDDARVLFEAVTNNPNGVLIWLQQHW